MQYTWLNGEAKAVKWRGFYDFKRNFCIERIERIEALFGKLPNDYVEFLKVFGETRLFHEIERDSYKLYVQLPRLEAMPNTGDILVDIGWFDFKQVYLRRKPKGEVPEVGIYEGNLFPLRKAADSFTEWLMDRFKLCRKKYTKKIWAQIIAGPTPFSKEELDLIDAMQKFSFRRIGSTATEQSLVEIHNGSMRELKCLTAGVKHPGLLGSVRLDVSGIAPGETKVIERDCYDSNVGTPDEIELYRLPTPLPEHRGMFWEFGLK